MAKKIYLSAAAHATDNKTKCPVACSENTHCNLYMDKLETRLREVGFAVKRGDKALTGSQAMTTRVAEANQWKADIYYVEHLSLAFDMKVLWLTVKTVLSHKDVYRA